MPLPVKLPLLPAAMQELTALVKDQGITGGFKEDDGSAAELAYVLSGAVTGKLFARWEQEPWVAQAVNQCIVNIIMMVDDLLPFEDRLGLVFSRDRGDTGASVSISRKQRSGILET